MDRTETSTNNKVINDYKIYGDDSSFLVIHMYHCINL